MLSACVSGYEFLYKQWLPCVHDWLAVYMYSYYQTESVLIALGITAAVCISISLFAIQTKVSTGVSIQTPG